MTIKITAMIIPDYTCSVCNNTALGSGAVNIEKNSTFEFTDEVNNEIKRPDPNNMSIGWSSYGNNVFKCGKCSVSS